MPTTLDLAAELTAFTARAADGFWRRFCPAGRLPRFIAGERTFAGTRSALLATLPELLPIGIERVAGTPVRDLIAQELGRVRASDCKTWWSLYVLEALAATGARFAGHPLLAGMSDAQRAEIAAAGDTTRVVDRAQGALIGHPINYWFVVARCEELRVRLGLTDDRGVLDLCLAKCRESLAGNTCRYMDDSEEGRGRYDLYASHGLAGACELAALADLAPPFAAAWERLLLATARSDGGSVSWGRSGGFNAIQAALEKSALLLARGLAGDRPRLAALAWAAARRLMDQGWADDAIAYHRGRRMHWYLYPGRIGEMSCLYLKSLAHAAHLLAGMPPLAIPDAGVLDGDRDVFIPFDARGPGVWVHRQGALRFQVPLVDGFTSDYAAAPVWPGVFEQPCDRGYPTGVPVVEMAGKRWLPLRRPVDVVAAPGALRWRTPGWTNLVDWDWWKGSADKPGGRAAALRVVDGWLEGDEVWTFPEVPEAIGFWFGESDTPLEVQWDCAHAHQATVLVVDGMADWRSHERQIRRLHQIDVEPAAEVRLTWRVRPR